MTRALDYDAIAADYDRRYREQEYSGIERALVDFLGGDRSVLAVEVGCGTGHWLHVLADRSIQAMGLDRSIEMLQQARRRTVPLVQGQAGHLPWPAAACARVFCIHAFHHFPDKAAFLAEACRILRPDGGLMIVGLDPHTGHDRWWIYDTFPSALESDRQRYPPSAWIRDAMARVGFARCETKEVQHIVAELPARFAIARGLLDRSFTSQLTLLPEAEYRRGLDRIRAQTETAEARGDEYPLAVDLRLFATMGWLE